MTVVNLNSKRAPVVYTVTIVHHYDGTLEFRIEDVADDPRSREAVMDAFRRISGAADRIEKLEAALREVIDCWDWWQVDTYDRCASVPADAIRDAREALEGKDE